MNRELCKQAVELYGVELQMSLLQEECAELIVAVSHLRRRDYSTQLPLLFEELADVSIMIEQMRVIFGDLHIDNAIERKLIRLRDRIMRKHKEQDDASDSIHQ